MRSLQLLQTLPLLLSALSGSTQTSNYPIGSTVANFTTLDTDGQFHTLYDLTAAGKTVMLDFYFYSCEPCQQYAASYSELYDTYGCNQGDLVCFHVNAGIDPDALADQFVEDFGGPFEHPPVIGQFNGGLLTDIFGVGAFPTLCVIAPDNTMWNDNVWPVDLESLVSNFPEGTAIEPMPCSVNTAIGSPEQAQPMVNVVGDQLVVQCGLPGQLELLDPDGRAVAQWTISANDASTYHSMPSLGGGAYLVRLTTTQGSSTSKVVRLP